MSQTLKMSESVLAEVQQEFLLVLGLSFLCTCSLR